MKVNKEGLIDFKLSGEFINEIFDGMHDWVRVIDLDDNIVYMNRAMSEGLKLARTGMKCYTAVGRESPCENCVSRQAILDGRPQLKEEVINDRTFSVMSSPLKDKSGETLAVIEVLRDITEMKKLQERVMEQNRKLQEDLSIAKKLQSSLLPKEQPDDRIGFFYCYKPCEALGGDFFDLFRIDGNHIGVYVADVSGHGVPASMLTVFLHSSINRRTLSPAEALVELYKEFNKYNFSYGMYITVFYAILDLAAPAMTFSNAGHNTCPVIISRDMLMPLQLSGIPISNWVKNPEYRDEQVPLEYGDRIFLYTDGISELRNLENEQFGQERIQKILRNCISGPENIFDVIIKKACAHAGIKDIAEIPDDITMMLLQIKKDNVIGTFGQGG